MSTAGVSVRSLLAAGMSAAAVGAVALTPVTPAQPLPALSPVISPVHVNVDVALTSAGSAIINGYNAIEPWVAYGFEVADYALSFVPGLWWIAPAIDLAYFTIEPLVEAGVYSFAYLIDGQFGLIGPTIQAGIQNSINNAVQYAIDWVGSLVPLPPIPPFPPFPGASVGNRTSAAAVTRAAAAVAAVEPAAEAAVEVATVAEPVTEPSAETLPEVAAPTKARAGRTSLRAPRAEVAKAAAATASDATPAQEAVTSEADASPVAGRQGGAARSAATDHTGKPARSAAGRAG